MSELEIAAAVLIGLSVALAAYTASTVVWRFRNKHPTLDGKSFARPREVVSAVEADLGQMVLRNGWFAELRVKLKRNLVRAGRGMESAHDYLGHCLFTGLTSALAVFVVVSLVVRSPAPVLALVSGVVGFYYPVLRLRETSDARITRFSRRLPYVVDMLVLAIDAGATFDEAVYILIADDPDEPCHQELDTVMLEQKAGKARAEALEALAERVGTDDVANLVMNINIGDKLGTPIVKTLREQADAMRLMRTQRAERLAREAGPKMALPSTLIMAANVLLIIGPLVQKFSSGEIF